MQDKHVDPRLRVSDTTSKPQDLMEVWKSAANLHESSAKVQRGQYDATHSLVLSVTHVRSEAKKALALLTL